MATPASNIRVSVHWANSTVFAGEDVECTITFTNTASTVPSHSSSHRRRNGGVPPPRTAPAGAVAAAQRQSKLVPGPPQSTASTRPAPLSRMNSTGSQAVPPAQHTQIQLPTRDRGHRPTLSLSTVTGTVKPGPGSIASTTQAKRPAHRHGRSLSIISIGTDVTAADGKGKGAAAVGRRGGHARSASMQVLSRNGGSVAASSGRRSTTQPSPLTNFTYPSTAPVEQSEFSPPPRSSREPGVSTAPGTPRLSPGHKKALESIPQGFRFPAAPALNRSRSAEPATSDPATSPRSHASQLLPHASRPPEDPAAGNPRAPSPLTRFMSNSSVGGTPRSSGEFYYSMGSNNSSETLASEYISQPGSRLLPPGTAHSSPNHNLAARVAQKAETLMMGYAQLMGTFTLDGSLVNQAPFEDVKRKGVLGSQGGGGVVGIERSKRDSGLFGALGWGNFGESLGGLLGSGELSSIKEMRGVASAKTVPLLSTPQSILFVDLNLSPGESRSFRYAFSLPKGLPPTYKGRAIKVHYHLTIGTQRSGQGKEQQVRQADVPFRVMGSVNSHGEILGHDLMSPYIILDDAARTSTIPPSPSLAPALGLPQPSTDYFAAKSSGSLSDFLGYANLLLSRSTPADAPLLSPGASATAPKRLRRTSSLAEEPEPQSMKESIDLAILRSRHAATAAHPNASSGTTFRISRAGRPVAILSLTRPAFRLGEVVHLAIDFSPHARRNPSPSPSRTSRTPSSTSRTPSPRKPLTTTPPNDPPATAPTALSTHTLLASLETTESIDPAIALRSATSITRVTRRVHASAREWVGFARRVVLALPLPPPGGGPAVAPEFATSGVGMAWGIRVEFTVAAAVHARDDDEGGREGGGAEMLEEVGRDERGVVLAPVERVAVESFDVVVPIRVYGTTGVGSGGGEGGSGDVEGLVV